MSKFEWQFGRGGLNEQVSVTELVEHLGLYDEEIEWRKEFIDFDEADAARIAALEEEFAAREAEMAEAFYEQLLGYEQTREVIERSSKGIPQLKETQRAYLRSLASGEYDEEYFANRARIGKIHELLEMPMKQYLGQYNVYYELFRSVVGDQIRERLADSIETHPGIDTQGVSAAALTEDLMGDVEAGLDEFHSLLKLLNLDMQVATDTYIQSRVDDLRIERDRFAALFENVPTPVVAVRVDDGSQRVERVNPAFKQLFGVTAKDLHGDSFEDILRPPDIEPRPVDEWTAVDPHSVTSEHELSKAEVTLKTKFGRREFIRVSAPIDREELEDIEYAFYMDVTDQKQRQERIEVLGRILRHDIRNQMQVVGGYAGLLRETEDDERKRQLIDEIEEASEELLSLTDQVRNVERVISGRADRFPVDIRATVETVVEELRAEYPDCSFSLSVPEDVWIKGTEAARIALENVIENAAEHNDAPDPTVEVTATEKPARDHVIVHIKDNGPGIPKTEHEVLTGKRERSQIDHTSGIGLWIVNWIVTRLGGSLRFDSNVPRGSVVTLRLPRTAPPEPDGHE